MEKAMDLKESILSILYPRRCPICHDIVEPKGKLICDACKKKVHYIREPGCKKCSKPLEKQEAEYCFDCAGGKHVYTKGAALFPYDGCLKESIEYFKFHNRREYAKWYAEEAAVHLSKKISVWNADCLIPVPIHRTKLTERGYNQASLIARELGRRIALTVDEEVLVRCKKTLPQKSLNNKERIKNLQNAFQMKENVVQYKKVIIVDDIYTTGSTVDACARVLLNAGVKEVYFLCLCIGYGC